MKRTILASAAVFLVSGCAYFDGWTPAPESADAGEAETGGAEVPVTPEQDTPVETAPMLPARIEQNSDVAFSSAEFPEQLQIIAPRLDARLRADARADFDMIELEAQTYKDADPDYFMPYGLGHTWTLLGAAGDLVSLHGLSYYNTGGAHPNYSISGLIYDRSNDQVVDVLDLFSGREAAIARLVPLVRAEIVAEKQNRYAASGMSDADIAADVESGLPDSGLWLTQAALTASTEGDVFGGLEVYFSPYELGSYAEGAYEAGVSQAAFRDLLKPEYRTLFAGEPAGRAQN